MSADRTPHPVPHCRVLPPGEFNGMSQPLPVYSEIFMAIAAGIYPGFHTRGCKQEPDILIGI